MMGLKFTDRVDFQSQSGETDLHSSNVRLGELDCSVVSAADSDGPFDLGVVLCHGFGAPGDDLVPLAAEILGRRSDDDAKVVFFFPAAPIVLESVPGFESRAWWPIDMERLLISIETGQFDRLRMEDPDRLPDARRKLETVLATIKSEYGLSNDRIILGGFSQGAMLATEVGLSMRPSPAAVCLYSGSLIKEEKWNEIAAAAEPLDILQSHGRVDPVLPYLGATALHEMLKSHGHQVEFIEFDGVHTIPVAAVVQLAKLIDRKLP